MDKRELENKARRKRGRGMNSRLPSKPGHKFVSYCPECDLAVGVGPKTKEVTCKNNHTWTVKQ